MARYFEIIITGRQLAWLVAGVLVLIGAAFGLGVAVRWFEPAPPREFIAAPPPTIAPARPAAAEAASATPTPSVAALLAGTPAPLPSGSAAAPAPTALPPATPTVQAAGSAAVPTRVVVPPSPAASPAAPVLAVAPAALPAAERPAGRWVQVTAVSRREQADGVRTRAIALGFTAEQVVVQPAPAGKFRVRVGPFPDMESAARVAARLQAQGFKGAFVARPGD
ncbi:MAG TPA: SPOR domain-containing protein [Thermoanaerobaculaceae bacterium]|nr:SPOR domain-containing protein [Thermoanaerobaculaceae bacterium]